MSLETQESGPPVMEIIRSQALPMGRLLVTQWLMVWLIPEMFIPDFEPGRALNRRHVAVIVEHVKDRRLGPGIGVDLIREIGTMRMAAIGRVDIDSNDDPS